MNVITAFLETMFAAHPATPRMLEAKAELHAMMEDAFTGYLAQGMTENEAVGRVITEFGNLDELAPQLGISAEIAAQQAPIAAQQATPVAAENVRAGQAPRTRLEPAPVTQDEAERYAEARRTTQPRLALAVAMLVCSPVVLIALTTLASGGAIAIDGQVASLIGLGCLLVLVVLAVLVLVRRRQALAPFVRLTDGTFTRSPGVEQWAERLVAEQAPKRTTALQIAIALWVLAVFPVLAVSLLTPPSVASVWSGVATTGLLLMVAAGLLVLIPANWAVATAKTLEAGGGSLGRRTEGDDSIIGVIAAFYWPLTVVIFLAWSFIGNAWYISWIIWPIAGVLFGAIAGGTAAIERYRAMQQS